MFDGSITNGKNSSGDAINALADFLLGDIKTGTYSLAQPLIGRRNYNIGLYIQDDWKVESKADAESWAPLGIRIARHHRQ